MANEDIKIITLNSNNYKQVKIGFKEVFIKKTLHTNPNVYCIYLGETSLVWASQSGHHIHDVTRILLENGAEVNARMYLVTLFEVLCSIFVIQSFKNKILPKV